MVRSGTDWVFGWAEVMNELRQLIVALQPSSEMSRKADSLSSGLTHKLTFSTLFAWGEPPPFLEVLASMAQNTSGGDTAPSSWPASLAHPLGPSSGFSCLPDDDVRLSLACQLIVWFEGVHPSTRDEILPWCIFVFAKGLN